MKFLLLFIMVFLVLFILSSWLKRHYSGKCPTAKIIYKPYVRTFIEEQEQPGYAFTMFKKMFHSTSPWDELLAGQTVSLKRGRQNPFILGERPKNILPGENNNRDDYLNKPF
jgi:hypothetical protein